MASNATRADFVTLVAQEIANGIDDATNYWLGRIETELLDVKLTIPERLRAVELVLREYKEATGRVELNCAAA